VLAQTNGDFAANLTGWIATGNVFPEAGLASFNGNATSDSAPNGVLAQTIPTTPGGTYTVAFDMGVNGSVAGEQRLRVGVEEFSLVKSGAVTQWQRKTHTFTATTAATTLMFTDVSRVTDGIDLLLDNVVVSEAIAVVPTITGSSVSLAWNGNPESDVATYTLHCGQVRGAYTRTATAVSPQTTATVTGLAPGSWYFAVSATSASGLVGPRSAEVSALLVAPPTPPVAPTGLRVLTIETSQNLTDWTVDGHYVVKANPDGSYPPKQFFRTLAAIQSPTP
jgi:hypothetical protein